MYPYATGAAERADTIKHVLAEWKQQYEELISRCEGAPTAEEAVPPEQEPEPEPEQVPSGLTQSAR
jgi:hypothetical protein